LVVLWVCAYDAGPVRYFWSLLTREDLSCQMRYSYPSLDIRMNSTNRAVVSGFQLLHRSWRRLVGELLMRSPMVSMFFDFPFPVRNFKSILRYALRLIKARRVFFAAWIGCRGASLVSYFLSFLFLRVLRRTLSGYRLKSRTAYWLSRICVCFLPTMM